MNRFFERKFLIQAIFIGFALILLGRLFYIQIVTNKYMLSANNNVLHKLIIYPARGTILDRKKHILVQNEPVYDLMIIPQKVKSLDTALFCRLIGLEQSAFKKRLLKAKKYSPYKASLFEKQLSAQSYASLQERLFEFPGFFVQNRTVRNYPDSIAAQFLGYVGEVNHTTISKSGGFYRQGDYIGISGVEKFYEIPLRGKRGVQNIVIDVLGREKGHFSNGKYDTLAVFGEKLISSIDRNLQEFGEKLMKNKIGSIVAIEPSSGEILAFVSSPSYDPNLMVGKKRGYNYTQLLNNPHKPMFIRPIQAEYPPGSIFKIINGLIAQQLGAIDSNTLFNCYGGYNYGSNSVMGCEHIHGTISLRHAIAGSCNTYFGYTYNRLIDHAKMRPVNAYRRWRDAVIQFGIADTLGIDLPNEHKGLLPTSEFYTKRWGNDKWESGFNISLSIGQGELGITPLQMANVMAIVANQGFFYKPHLIKAIGKNGIVKKKYTNKNSAGIAPNYFKVIIDGMSDVVNSPKGTAYYSLIPGIEMCGKTGTAQNIQGKGKTHSVFFAFAPRLNPKIAIAVVVENAGYGSAWSAPIASVMVEKYLKDSISRPKEYLDRLFLSNLLPETPSKRKK